MTIAAGLVGYGLGGAVFHAPLIQACPGLSLAAVATSRSLPDGIARAASAEALIADAGIDLVVIAAPNALHYPLARAALEARKHVVLDKPFVLTSAEADELIALAAARSSLLTVFHNRRWDGDFLTARRLLAAGRLGEVMLAELAWDRFRPALRAGWKDGGDAGTGLLYDLGPHLIDQAMLLFGQPDAVAGDLAVQREEGRTDDYFSVTLHYGARRVRLSAATLVAAPRPRFALHGSAASFVKYGVDPQEEQLKAGLRPGDAGFGEEAAHAHGTLTPAGGEPEPVATERGCYCDFYLQVAAAIAGDGAPPVDPAEARDGLAIIEAARRGARDGIVVRPPFGAPTPA